VLRLSPGAFAFHNTQQNLSPQAVELPDLTLIPLEVDRGTMEVDLFLSMWEEAQDLTGRLVYATELFDTTTVTRMLEHFQILLEGIVAAPISTCRHCHAWMKLNNVSSSRNGTS